MKHFFGCAAAVGAALSADSALAQQNAADKATLTRAEGMVMLDYQVIPVPGDLSIDLMGFHFLNRMNDWLYLGVGGYAPLFKGDYGGFMALDVTAHAQRKLFGNFFADAGVSLGGGGGGKSSAQSKILSGTGGFIKTYVGLGHEFEDFSVGVNVARMKFNRSTIDHTQLNAYVQIPFSYTIGAYSNGGQKLFSDASPSSGADSSESMLTLGLDNYIQINPRGLSKATINAADLQFSHFITRNSYWFANAGVGIHGLALYNQVLGGLGYRWQPTSSVNLYAQLGVGSGGYAPQTIDTGPGLLVFPKLSAEYLFDKNLGVSLSAGYLAAPKASSKNYTVGASLNYHIRAGEGAAAGDSADGTFYRGYRINLFPQLEFSVRDRGADQTQIKMITAQLDTIVGQNFYIPVQASVAVVSYLGYPGYGELMAGLGVQTKYDKDSRFQWFGQLLVGANTHGAIMKPGLGLNVGLSDRLAVYGMVGQTFAIKRNEDFRANYAGLGLSYRFSVPTR